MNKTLIALTLPLVLSACGVVSTQAVYEEIRAQEKARAVGKTSTPGTQLPHLDAYQKERATLRSEPATTPNTTPQTPPPKQP
jgi:hypothetical protein